MSPFQLSHGESEPPVLHPEPPTLHVPVSIPTRGPRGSVRDDDVAEREAPHVVVIDLDQDVDEGSPGVIVIDLA